MVEVGDKVKILERIKGKGRQRFNQINGTVVYTSCNYITVQKENKGQKLYNTTFMMSDILDESVRIARH